MASVKECSLGHLSSGAMFLTVSQYHLPGFLMGRMMKRMMKKRKRERRKRRGKAGRRGPGKRVSLAAG